MHNYDTGTIPNPPMQCGGRIIHPIQCKIIHPKGKLPTRATDGSCGLDLYAAAWKPFGDTMMEYDTGIAVAIPEGYVGLVFPRSSITGTSLRLGNSVGVIDRDYRGTIRFRFDNLMLKDSERHYDVGDKIGQLVLVPCPVFESVEVADLPETARGSNGFGSTGRK